MNNIDQFLESFASDPCLSKDIAHWHYEKERPGCYQPIPHDLHGSLRSALESHQIDRLYSHQTEAWNLIRSGMNVIITTGTASGKTLCYNLPILQSLIDYPDQTALNIYPTRALAQDQLRTITGFQYSSPLSKANNQEPPYSINAAIYDGDTPSHLRQSIKKRANFILTNPDMLHLGILPHHTTWQRLFESLKYVVIDEAHTYRGIFGSHVANLITRFRRVCTFYGSDPLFILTSATIANPREHAERLVGAPFHLIDKDGAPFVGRTHVMLNPAIINADLGIRRGTNHEAGMLASLLIKSNVQSILFTRSRRSVEILLRDIRDSVKISKDNIQGYRSGYLSSERRVIESGLKSGKLALVISTNALEMGMDIGGVDVVSTIGYPGTIAALRQQAGRAGRRQNRSAVVFISSQNPIDQYLIDHADYLISTPVEKALINPDNLSIRYAHIRCALFELPFSVNDGFGELDSRDLLEYLNVLEENREARIASGKAIWIGRDYPAQQVSLRSSSSTILNLYAYGESGDLIRIGVVDRESAPWMVHEEAIYLHQAEPFLVKILDLDQRKVVMEPVEGDYFTEPVREMNIEIVNIINNQIYPTHEKWLAEVLVTSTVTGFRKIAWSRREVLGVKSLSMPPSEILTDCLGITLSESLVEKIKEIGDWKSGKIDYGPEWNKIKNQIRNRDGYRCNVCGIAENEKKHHVHHILPFKVFTSWIEANRMDNLVTLCPKCHQRAENVVRLRSGLSGLSYITHHLASLFLMCDIEDIGRYSDAQSKIVNGNPVIILYEMASGGTGLSSELYNSMDDLWQAGIELIASCSCQDGCPSCVGPGGEAGYGGKLETLLVLNKLLDHNI